MIRTYCGRPELAGHLEVDLVAFDPATGGLDLDDLGAKLSTRTAAVLFENPGFLGIVEPNAAEIAALARAAGAETVVGVDPISLGVLAPPGEYGADIVVGSIQPLGVHMSAGGGVGGFIATRDEERYAHQYPTLNVSIAETSRRRARLRNRSLRADLVRQPRGGQRLDRATRRISTRSRTPPTWR